MGGGGSSGGGGGGGGRPRRMRPLPLAAHAVGAARWRRWRGGDLCALSHGRRGGGEAPQHAEGCRLAIRAAGEALQHAEGLPPRDTGGGSASHGQQLRIFGRNADGAMLLRPRRDQVSRRKSAGPRRRATALP